MLSDEEWQEQNLHMMKTSALWPLGNHLPLKNKDKKDPKRKNWPTFGFLYCGWTSNEVEPIVYEFAASEIPAGWTLADVPQTKYDSFEELVADGWIVD